MRVITCNPGDRSFPDQVEILAPHVGEAYVLTRPQSLAQIDHVRFIAATIGRTLRFEEQSGEQFRESLLLHHRLPTPVIDEILDQFAARERKTAQILPAVEEVTGRPAFIYAKWVAHRAAEFDSAPA